MRCWRKLRFSRIKMGSEWSEEKLKSIELNWVERISGIREYQKDVDCTSIRARWGPKMWKWIFEALRCVRFRMRSRKWMRCNQSFVQPLRDQISVIISLNSLSWGEWIESQPNCCQMKMQYEMQDYTKCNPRSLSDLSFRLGSSD